MSWTQRLRMLSAFALLSFALSTATVQARASRPNHASRPAATAPASFLGSVWHFLTHLWGEEGASIDPWGQPSPTSGGSIDPNGGGLSNASGATGMTIDPWGNPSPAPTTGSATGGSGMSIDPNG
jgi:hypothetical protein